MNYSYHHPCLWSDCDTTGRTTAWNQPGAGGNYDTSGEWHRDWSQDLTGGLVWDVESGTAGQLAPDGVRVALRNALQMAPGTSEKDVMRAGNQGSAAFRNVAVDLRTMVKDAQRPGWYRSTGADYQPRQNWSRMFTRW